MSAWSDRQLARSSLKAYYRFGEASGTVLDDAGPNNLDGTYAASGVALGAASLISDDADTAVTFDGSSDGAIVPDSNALDLGDGPFTIKFLVKRSATQGANQALLSKGVNAYYVTFATNNTLRLVRSGSGGFIAAIAAITDQDRHHIAITKNGATTLIYKDGVDATIAGTAGTLVDTATALRIAHLSAASQRFPGSLDELTFDNAVLDAAYIAEDARIARSLYGSAVLSGEGTLSAAGVRALAGAAALEGAVDLAAIGHRASYGAAALESDLGIQAAGGALRAGDAALTGEGALQAAGSALLAGAAILSGEGTLAATGTRARAGAAALAGELALQAAGIRARYGAAALDGALELIAAGAKIASGAASLAGELVLSVVGPSGMGFVEGRSGSSSLDRVGAASACESGGSHSQEVEPRGGATGLHG